MEPLVLRAEHLLPVQCELGEAPLWDAQSACLYWLDIAGARLYRWSYGEPPGAGVPPARPAAPCSGLTDRAHQVRRALR